MGLLDDAIREHLELKRRRGADADEVSRLEQEALGPPQRGEFAGAGAAPAEPVEPDAPAEPTEPVEPSEPVEAAEPAPTAETEWLEDEPETRWLEDEPEPVQEPVADDPPAAYQAPHAEPGAEPAAEGDDVLEETPDFLQETP